MDENQFPNELIIFDGMCKFCNASINFIIRNDPNTAFYFSSAQSITGRNVLEGLGLNPSDPTTFVLLKNGIAYTQSNAAIEIAKNLKTPWSYFGVLKIVPRALRDWIYAFIARNRYRILGKLDSCMIPTAEHKSRFLD